VRRVKATRLIRPRRGRAARSWLETLGLAFFAAAIFGTAATSGPAAAGEATDVSELAPASQAHRVRAPSGGTASRPRIGLVLGGGGARGAAHVGVLAVLEELRIPVDYITGTSMGSIVGGLYAGGLSPEDLRSVVEDVDWVEIFQDHPPRQERSFRRKQDDLGFLTSARFGVKNWGFFIPPGFMQGQKLDFLLRSLNLTGEGMTHFEDLAIPFRAFATEIATGAVVAMQTGDVARAMRASMSIPGAFSPVKIDGRTLVDGGIVRNLPIGDVQEMGADVVIAVDVSTLLRDNQTLTALGITSQILTIQIQENQEEEVAKLRDGDILIRPDLEGIGTASFPKMGRAIRSGWDAALQARKSLERYSLSPEAYEEWRGSQRRPAVGLPVISEIRIVNESRLSSQTSKARRRSTSR
jgi:NTE family protein